MPTRRRGFSVSGRLTAIVDETPEGDTETERRQAPVQRTQAAAPLAEEELNPELQQEDAAE